MSEFTKGQIVQIKSVPSVEGEVISVSSGSVYDAVTFRTHTDVTFTRWSDELELVLVKEKLELMSHTFGEHSDKYALMVTPENRLPMMKDIVAYVNIAHDTGKVDVELMHGVSGHITVRTKR